MRGSICLTLACLVVILGACAGGGVPEVDRSKVRVRKVRLQQRIGVEKSERIHVKADDLEDGGDFDFGSCDPWSHFDVDQGESVWLPGQCGYSDILDGGLGIDWHRPGFGGGGGGGGGGESRPAEFAFNYLAQAERTGPDSFFIRFGIWNPGWKPTNDASHRLTVIDNFTSELVFTTEMIFTSPIGVLEVFEFGLAVDVPDGQGSYDARIELDIYDQTKELDEFNNLGVITFGRFDL